MRVDFTIPSSPVTKARPRFNTRTGRAFTDDKTRIFENIVSLAYGSRHYFDDSYIRVRIKFKFDIPKSFSKKKRLEALEGKIRPNTAAASIIPAANDNIISLKECVIFLKINPITAPISVAPPTPKAVKTTSSILPPYLIF